MLVDGHLAPPVGFQACSRQVEVRGRPLAANRVQGLLRDDDLARGEHRLDVARGQDGAAGYFLPQPQRHPLRAQVVRQLVGELPIHERQQLGPRIDQRDACAQRGEHARVLTADHPCAHNRERLGDGAHRQDRIGVQDALPVERDLAHLRDLAPGRNHDRLRRDGARTLSSH